MYPGLKCIKEGSGACAVVFIHGILSDGETCWRHSNGTYWPDVLAAADSCALLSIFVYTYQSDIFSADYDLHDVVDDLRQRLRHAAIEDFSRIIFVCHSMGGIVARRYLVRRQQDADSGVGVKTYGLLLVASPSLGSEFANWLSRLAKFFRHSQADVLRFSSKNRWLDTLDRDFRDLKESGRLALRGRELIEDKFVTFRQFFVMRKVVERISGARYFGEALKIAGSDHFSIAKPEDLGAIQNSALVELIAEVVPDFGPVKAGGRTPSVASSEKFSVAVARLEGDEEQQESKKVTRAMQDFFDGIGVHEHSRVIKLRTGSQDSALELGHAEARRMIREVGVDALVWGEVLSAGVKKQLRLHWTLPAVADGAKSTERYSAEEFDLPPLFWDDLTNTLAAVVTASAAKTLGEEGRYIADRLKDVLPKTATLLKASRERWSESAWTKVALAHAEAAAIYGDQAGDNEALMQAVSTYQDILARSTTREKVALYWVSLGDALAVLGAREGGTTRLEAAVEAYKEALKEYTRDKVPPLWANTQNNLGNALLALGERESGTTHVVAAVDAFKDALKERPRGKVPRYWAMTQNNLGNALRVLGERERESGTIHMEAAVDACNEALTEYTRDKVPLHWAMTQLNLGNALGALGEREGGTTHLGAAVHAYEEALKEYTRDKMPLLWANTQNNLGHALHIWGDRESGTTHLEAAVGACKEALKERTRDKVPLYWAMTQDNLGMALRILGERESDTTHLEAAVDVFKEALKERTRDKVPLLWAMTQHNLGNALRALGERSGTTHLEAAADAFQEALKEFTRDKVALGWAMTLNDLGIALAVLGEKESGTRRLEDAVDAYKEALKERTLEKVPLDWAKTQTNLGIALGVIGERLHDAQAIRYAIGLFDAAIPIAACADALWLADGIRRAREITIGRLQWVSGARS